MRKSKGLLAARNPSRMIPFSSIVVSTIMIAVVQLKISSAYVIRTSFFMPCSRLTLGMSSSGGKGFGKQDTPNVIKKKTNKPQNSESLSQRMESTASEDATTKREIPLDPSLSPEERGKILLREKFGIKSFEERQAELKEAQYNEKLQRLKQKADKEREFDIFKVLPPPLLLFIDRLLKTGLAVSTLLFIAAGIGITMEAWSHASGGALPEGMDEFIVQTIEPNFTPGLFVLLGFSISLGLFSAAQLGSESSKYSEK